jgi:16S rRNA (cytidine1402-2'-O)-methyltransferase
MSCLYMVATPIGNLEDITLRALRILKEADAVACEDTRRTRRLLTHFGISTKVLACHANNEEQSARGIVQLLDSGSSIAYVSDAGTPGLSDPGGRLAGIVRDAGYQVVPVPGPSAFGAVCSAASGIGASVLFEGFLSPKGGRRRSRLQTLLDRNETFVLYESPFRILKLLEDLASLAPQRRVLVGRELTKVYEELVEGTAEAVHSGFSARPAVQLKGEFTVLVAMERRSRSGEDNQGYSG